MLAVIIEQSLSLGTLALVAAQWGDMRSQLRYINRWIENHDAELTKINHPK